MSISRKYGRTYHYTFSPGTTSDDRICHNWAEATASIENLLHTEKLDGENTCLSKLGVFARSHAAPTRHPWAGYLKERWEMIRHDLGELEVFGENLYAVHSIAYPNIESHFFVFGIREGSRWLSWEETCFYASVLDLPTVPVLATSNGAVAHEIEQTVMRIVKEPSTFGSIDVATMQPCTMEGVVSRNAAAYAVEDFARNVFKYVRKGHVKTDEHWSRKWRRAQLKWEGRSSNVED